jgi:hypothetical protein
MIDEFTMPKGRMTVRRSGGRRVRLWELGGSNNPTIKQLETAYLSSLDAMDRAEARKAEALKSGKFTPSGANDDALQFALTELVPLFKRGRNVIEQAKREAKALRDKVKLQLTDKTDVVGFLRRQEMRQWLKAMPNEARNKFIDHNLEKLDPDLALAIMEMPAEHTGVLPSQRDLLVDRALEAQHGEAMTQLRDLERGIEVAESAVEAGREEVRIEAGVMDRRAFDERAAPIEQKAAAPWLRKEGNQVVVVDLERRVTRPATPEELNTGVYYADYDDWAKHNAA